MKRGDLVRCAECAKEILIAEPRILAARRSAYHLDCFKRSTPPRNAAEPGPDALPTE
jgi:hypothetical protein